MNINLTKIHGAFRRLCSEKPYGFIDIWILREGTTRSGATKWLFTELTRWQLRFGHGEGLAEKLKG